MYILSELNNTQAILKLPIKRTGIKSLLQCHLLKSSLSIIEDTKINYYIQTNNNNIPGPLTPKLECIIDKLNYFYYEIQFRFK